MKKNNEDIFFLDFCAKRTFVKISKLLSHVTDNYMKMFLGNQNF